MTVGPVAGVTLTKPLAPIKRVRPVNRALRDHDQDREDDQELRPAPAPGTGTMVDITV